MHFVEKEPSQKRIDFAEKLKSNKILRVPGAYNPLTAKLIEEIGYDAVYVSGGVMANDLGFPDIGLTTLQDVSTRSYLISRVTNLPTIVDIDTGFKSCKETIETFEDFGIAAVHLEDQIERKRCGHLDNKELIFSSEIKPIIKLKKLKKIKFNDSEINKFLNFHYYGNDNSTFFKDVYQIEPGTFGYLKKKKIITKKISSKIKIKNIDNKKILNILKKEIAN